MAKEQTSVVVRVISPIEENGIHYKANEFVIMEKDRVACFTGEVEVDKNLKALWDENLGKYKIVKA